MRVKNLLWIIIVLSAPILFAGEERPWRAAEAEFRLIVHPERAAEATGVDLRRLVLPVLPENGVQVFDQAGNIVPFQLHANEMLAIAPAPKAKEFEIYFGFGEKQPMDTWTTEVGPRPPADRLQLLFFGGGNRPCLPDEFLAWRNADIERRNRWQAKAFAQRPLLLFGQVFLGMKPVAWVPAFPQYWKSRKVYWKRLNTRNRRQWLNAVWELNGSPENPIAPMFGNAWKAQWKAHFAMIRREMEKTRKQYEQARKDMPVGAENDLLGMLAWRNPRTFAATEVQLLVRPPETPEHYSGIFRGFLEIPSDGEYEFELMTNSLAVLRLDSKVLLRRNDSNGSLPSARLVAKVALKQGSVPFEAFYRLNTGFSKMTVRMRPAGEGEFQLLSAEDFSPSRIASPVKLAGKKHDFPLIQRRGHYLFYTGKRDFVPIESFRPLAAAAELEWREGDSASVRSIDLLPPAIVLSREPAKRLHFRFAGQAETELPVLFTDYRADLVALRPDLSLRLWNPPAVYEDETLPLTVEATSRLPFGVDAELDFYDGEKLLDTKSITLPGKQDERFHRAVADISQKAVTVLDSMMLRKGLQLEVRLRIGDFEFDRKRLMVHPVSAPSGWDAAAAADSSVLVLRRPTLGDVRNWELPKKIGEQLLPGRKILWISEDAAGLGEMLQERTAEKKQELEFVTYDATETPLESSMYRLLDAIEQSRADRIVLALPCLHHLGTLEPWMRDRYIAALLEKLRTGNTLRTIYLAPGASRTEDIAGQEELLTALRRLAREYGIVLLEPGSSIPEKESQKSELQTHLSSDLIPLLNRLCQEL